MTRWPSNLVELADAEDFRAAQEAATPELATAFLAAFHTSPSEWLARLRLAAARRALIETTRTLSDISATAGFQSQRAFAAAFRRTHALSPGDYRRLLGAERFTIELPPGFDAGPVLAHLERDPESLTERVRERSWAAGAWLGGAPAIAIVELGRNRASVELRARTPLPPLAAEEAHRFVLRRLGLAADPESFERRAAAEPEIARLIERRRGLRLPLTGTAFDALVWAVVGQQVNLPFAFRLYRRLVERAGAPVLDGLWAPPIPAELAALPPAELESVQFSRSKAQYVIGAAHVVASGALDLAALAVGSASRAEAELRAVRGIGPWTARYVLMRGLGFADSVPVGDAGLVRSLQTFFALGERPDSAETERLMALFRPHRSLATFHLWQRLKEE